MRGSNSFYITDIARTRLPVVMRFNPKLGGSSPSQAVRLIWFHLFFLSPMAAIAYVSVYGLKDAGEDMLIRVLLILAVFADREHLLRHSAADPHYRRVHNDDRRARQPVPCRR